MIIQSIAAILCFVYFILFAGSAAAETVPDPFPSTALSYLVKLNGKMLWAHLPDKKLPPASLTKIMTGLIAIEKADLKETVSVKKGAAGETGTRIGLNTGDVMTVGDLLSAALLQSANDACYALAEHIGGSHEKFVKMMNRRAKEIGLKNTRFTNACGHDGIGHYSTANDLALLAETALKNPVFSRIVSFVWMNISTVDGKRTFRIENKNELIGRYPGAVGIKSGFTRKAGKCLVALVKRDGATVLLVLLNAPNRWWDAVSILDNAFASQKQQAAVKR